MHYHRRCPPITNQDRLRTREDRERVRQLIDEWSTTGRSLRSVLRGGRMTAGRFWELVQASPDLTLHYQSRRGLWAFASMDGLLDEAETRLAETGHAAWGAVLQKQLHAMVAVMEPSLQVVNEADMPLPEAMGRIEEILDLGRERLARLQELEAAARSDQGDEPSTGVVDVTPVTE